MTVITHRPKYETLDLKKIIVSIITRYVKSYKKEYEIESINFNSPIDGIIYVKTFIHYSDEKFTGDWFYLKVTTLLKVLKSLKEKDFYGLCKISNDRYIKIIPKKNDT